MLCVETRCIVILFAFVIQVVCNSMCVNVISGRGPLVRASIAAAREAGRQLRVYAVEKNPAAVVHIQAMVNEQGWHDKVTIIAQDMRTWEPTEKVCIESY